LSEPGNRHPDRSFPEPDWKKLSEHRARSLTGPDHKPYDLSAANGITRHAAPGTRIMSGKYPVVTGLEHDELGHPTGSPKLHMQMVAQTAQKAAKPWGLRFHAASLRPAGRQHSSGWLGSTQGPIREAVDRAARGGRQRFGDSHQAYQSLPPGLENIFAGFNHVFVVEMNDEGLYGTASLPVCCGARYCDQKLRESRKPTASLLK